MSFYCCRPHHHNRENAKQGQQIQWPLNQLFINKSISTIRKYHDYKQITIAVLSEFNKISESIPGKRYLKKLDLFLKALSNDKTITKQPLSILNKTIITLQEITKPITSELATPQSDWIDKESQHVTDHLFKIINLKKGAFESINLSETINIYSACFNAIDFDYLTPSRKTNGSPFKVQQGPDFGPHLPLRHNINEVITLLKPPCVKYISDFKDIQKYITTIIQNLEEENKDDTSLEIIKVTAALFLCKNIGINPEAFEILDKIHSDNPEKLIQILKTCSLDYKYAKNLEDPNDYYIQKIKNSLEILDLKTLQQAYNLVVKNYRGKELLFQYLDFPNKKSSKKDFENKVETVLREKLQEKITNLITRSELQDITFPTLDTKTIDQLIELHSNIEIGLQEFRELDHKIENKDLNGIYTNLRQEILVNTIYNISNDRNKLKIQKILDINQILNEIHYPAIKDQLEMNLTKQSQDLVTQHDNIEQYLKDAQKIKELDERTAYLFGSILDGGNINQWVKEKNDFFKLIEKSFTDLNSLEIKAFLENKEDDFYSSLQESKTDFNQKEKELILELLKQDYDLSEVITKQSQLKSVLEKVFPQIRDSFKKTLKEKIRIELSLHNTKQLKSKIYKQMGILESFTDISLEKIVELSKIINDIELNHELQAYLINIPSPNYALVCEFDKFLYHENKDIYFKLGEKKEQKFSYDCDFDHRYTGNKSLQSKFIELLTCNIKRNNTIIHQYGSNYKWIYPFNLKHYHEKCINNVEGLVNFIKSNQVSYEVIRNTKSAIKELLNQIEKSESILKSKMCDISILEEEKGKLKGMLGGLEEISKTHSQHRLIGYYINEIKENISEQPDDLKALFNEYLVGVTISTKQASLELILQHPTIKSCLKQKKPIKNALLAAIKILAILYKNDHKTNPIELIARIQKSKLFNERNSKVLSGLALPLMITGENYIPELNEIETLYFKFENFKNSGISKHGIELLESMLINSRLLDKEIEKKHTVGHHFIFNSPILDFSTSIRDKISSIIENSLIKIKEVLYNPESDESKILKAVKEFKTIESKVRIYRNAHITALYGDILKKFDILIHSLIKTTNDKQLSSVEKKSSGTVNGADSSTYQRKKRRRRLPQLPPEKSPAPSLKIKSQKTKSHSPADSGVGDSRGPSPVEISRNSNSETMFNHSKQTLIKILQNQYIKLEQKNYYIKIENGYVLLKNHANGILEISEIESESDIPEGYMKIDSNRLNQQANQVSTEEISRQASANIRNRYELYQITKINSMPKTPGGTKQYRDPKLVRQHDKIYFSINPKSSESDITSKIPKPPKFRLQNGTTAKIPSSPKPEQIKSARDRSRWITNSLSRLDPKDKEKFIQHLLDNEIPDTLTYQSLRRSLKAQLDQQHRIMTPSKQSSKTPDRRQNKKTPLKEMQKTPVPKTNPSIKIFYNITKGKSVRHEDYQLEIKPGMTSRELSIIHVQLREITDETERRNIYRKIIDTININANKEAFRTELDSFKAKITPKRSQSSPKKPASKTAPKVAHHTPIKAKPSKHNSLSKTPASHLDPSKSIRKEIKRTNTHQTSPKRKLTSQEAYLKFKTQFISLSNKEDTLFFINNFKGKNLSQKLEKILKEYPNRGDNVRTNAVIAKGYLEASKQKRPALKQIAGANGSSTTL